MHNADCRCLKQAVALADPVAVFGNPSVPANECVPDLPQLLVDQRKVPVLVAIQLQSLLLGGSCLNHALRQLHAEQEQAARWVKVLRGILQHTERSSQSMLLKDACATAC